MELGALLAIWIVLVVINYNLCHKCGWRPASPMQSLCAHCATLARIANKEMSVGGMAPSATRPTERKA